MFSIENVKTPAFLLNYPIARRNCQRMLEQCSRMELQLRPHMKTHKTIQGGELMTGGSKRCIVVSTISEAYFYADNGFDDIAYAYPLSRDKIADCKHLTEKLSKFVIMIDSLESLSNVAQVKFDNGNKQWNVFLGISTGYNREGILWNSTDELISIVKAINNYGMHFEGLYTHCGQSYSSSGKLQIEEVADDVTSKLLSVQKILFNASLACPAVSLGSTPTCSYLTENCKSLTEVHPGNYIFYDAQQKKIGACSEQDIACQVATRIIGHYPHNNQLLIDCGFAALSHDGANALRTGYGEIVSHPELKLYKMTQEIGMITSVNGESLNFSDFPIGSLLYIYPYHSCATAMMHPFYYIVEDDKIIDTWYPNRGWMPKKIQTQQLNQ